ncbi:zinc finger protein 564-like [Malaya genurostris]|uniref:zinc finger protein 564-like n=1 Tax=Malaya genurostris TaxID=325434 RepID=UPI0026F394D5|nr:zinc finger protein 564-like [Malaya genurostris]
MDDVLEEVFLIKEEPINPELAPIKVVTFPLTTSEAIDSHLDRFCRFCLRELPGLIPLMSRIQDILITDMIRTLMGLSITQLRLGSLRRICNECLVKLDYAYNIKKEFEDTDMILKSLEQINDVTLADSLQKYQKKICPNVTNCKSRTSSFTDTQSEYFIEHSTEELIEEERLDDLPEVGQKQTSPEQVKPLEKKRKCRRYNIEMKETKLDPNKCYICCEVFDSQHSLNVHLPVHVDMIPYSCQRCINESGQKKDIKSLILLHRHFRMHAGSIKCPKCPFQTCTAVGLYNHVQRYHGEETNTEYTCEICGSKMVNKRNYESHIRYHKAVDEGRYTCKYCDKKFATNARLVRHERSHTNEKPFRCKYCEKSFNNETSQNAHERTHTGERGYRCDCCGNCYRTSNALKEHLGSAHAESTGSKPRSQMTKSFFLDPVKCEVEGCDFSTINRAKYYSHKGKHELKYCCQNCSERFPTRQRLQQHMYKHTGIKPYCCELCGKGFRFKNSFNEHLDKHGNVRAYSCEICGMSFVRERTLKEHRLKHKEGMNYECRVCGKKFKYRADQSKHERTHADGGLKEEIVLLNETHEDMDLIEEDTEGLH